MWLVQKELIHSIENRWIQTEIRSQDHHFSDSKIKNCGFYRNRNRVQNSPPGIFGSSCLQSWKPCSMQG
jgi:hypothetical protein